MVPITHLVVDHAVQIDCEPLTPPMYYLEGQWIALTPSPFIKTPPITLQPEEEARIPFSPIRPISASGLYSREEIQRIQRLLTFGAQREAVPNIIERKMSDLNTDNQGLSTVRLFDPSEMKKLARSTLQYVWGWFTDIGMFFSGLIGVYVIIKLIKYVANTTLNGIAIYKTLGCGLTLLASLWNTLTIWFIHKHHTNSQRSRTNDAVIETPTVESAPTAAPSNVYPTWQIPLATDN